MTINPCKNYRKYCIFFAKLKNDHFLVNFFFLKIVKNFNEKNWNTILLFIRNLYIFFSMLLSLYSVVYIYVTDSDFLFYLLNHVFARLHMVNERKSAFNALNRTRSFYALDKYVNCIHSH